MIEISRYVLAAVVAETHLWPKGQDWTGQIAVFAFYTLSGYLITRVLNTRYGFTWRGTGAFALNRVLRLWPAYLVLMGITLIAMHYLPLQNFYPLIRPPKSSAEIITNAIIIGQVTFDFRQWVPLAKPLVTSWSLSIEVCCYFLLALYFARSSKRLLAFAALGVLAMALSTSWCATNGGAAVYGPYCFQNRYGVIQAGFVPFALGGAYYFHEKQVAAWIRKYNVALAIALSLAVGSLFFGPLLSATVGPFLGIPLMLLLLTAAQDYRVKRFHDFLGRASYHLFIGHMPIAAILMTGFHVTSNSFSIYAAVIAVAICLSAILVPMEWRFNAVRRRVAAIGNGSVEYHGGR